MTSKEIPGDQSKNMPENQSIQQLSGNQSSKTEPAQQPQQHISVQSGNQAAILSENEARNQPYDQTVTPESFLWYEKTLTLRELVDQFADHVPFLIKFITGYYGRDEDINYISAYETAWLHDIVAQERVAFTDSRNRHYSIPTQSAQKVHPVTPNGRDPALVTIPQLMASHTIRRFQFPAATLRNKLVCFKGPDDGHAMDDDVYDILETYQEKFIIIHAMTNTGLYESYILLPVYMPVDVVIAVGVSKGSVSRFHEQMLIFKDVADVCPHDYRRHMEAISGILYFDHKAVDTEYEALMPIGLFSRDNFYESMTQESKSPSASAKSSRDPGWRSLRQKGDVASSLTRISLGLDSAMSPKQVVQITAFTVRILEELQHTYQTRVLPSGEYMEKLTDAARKKLTCREAPNIRHQGQDLLTRPLAVGSSPLASIARFAVNVRSGVSAASTPVSTCIVSPGSAASRNTLWPPVSVASRNTLWPGELYEEIGQRVATTTLKGSAGNNSSLNQALSPQPREPAPRPTAAVPPAPQGDPAPPPRPGHTTGPAPALPHRASAGSPGIARLPAKTDKFKRSQSHSSASPDTPTRPTRSHSSHNNAPTANFEQSSTKNPLQPGAEPPKRDPLYSMAVAPTQERRRPSSHPAGKHKRISSIADIPGDIRSLGAEQIGQCLTLLNMDKYRKILKKQQVDGDLLESLDENTLKDSFQMSAFDAKKLVRFMNGWRPK